MGAEDFRISLFVPATIDRVVSELQQMPHVLRSAEHAEATSTAIYFVHDDGRHLFECETRPADQISTRVSVRFAICHPASVDEVFIGFVRALACRSGARIEVVEAVPEGMPFKFDPPGYLGLEQVLVQAIARKRRDWVLDFGSTSASLLPEEAIRRFILKE